MADIIVMSEPNNRRCSEGYFRDEEGGDTAIKLGVEAEGRATGWGQGGKGIVWVQLGGVAIVSCYVSPNTSKEEFRSWLLRLEVVIKKLTGNGLIVAGDFNAKDSSWGSPITDWRGRELRDLFAGQGIEVANTGNKPTFCRGTARSWIDVTAHKNIGVTGWKVMDRVTLSDHNLISYNVELDGKREWEQIEMRWDVRKLPKLLIAKALNNKRLSEKTAENKAKELTELIGEVCEKVVGRRKMGRKRGNYWWSPEIAAARKVAILNRRRITRARAKGLDTSELARCKREGEEALKLLIHRSKRECWSNLCREVEEDPWGKPYKIVTGKMRKKGIDPEAAVLGGRREVIEKLFPQGTSNTRKIRLEEVNYDQPSAEEIAEVAARVPKRKAPGPDGLPNEVVKAVMETHPELLSQVWESCLREGVFPGIWKKARVVLLHKTGKNPAHPSSYRPICLLDGLAKVLERFLANRMENHLEREGGYHQNQYGFRRGRSTTDAVLKVLTLARVANEGPLRKRKHAVMVALDVKNAFNSVPWHAVIEAADRRLPPGLARIVDSYLEERTIIYQAGGRDVERQLTRGVPQGSVLGPILWNLVYDGVLHLELPEGAEVVAFADDLALVARCMTMEGLRDIVEVATSKIVGWMRRVGLEVATEKTQAVFLSTKRAGRNKEERLLVGGHEIKIDKRLKYLGVWIEANPRHSNHCTEAAEAARRSEAAIARILPNTGGAGEGRRRLLASVARAKLAYAAPVWAKAMGTKRNASKARGALRTGALRIIRGYRTVSPEAAEVLATELSGDLYVSACAEAYWEAKDTGNKVEARKAAKDRAMDRWQSRWEEAESWTKILIPDVRKWAGRGHGEMTYEITQLFAGHGSFGAYRAKIGKTMHGKCEYCGGAEDTAKHTLRDCKEWEPERAELIAKLGGKCQQP